MKIIQRMNNRALTYTQRMRDLWWSLRKTRDFTGLAALRLCKMRRLALRELFRVLRNGRYWCVLFGAAPATTFLFIRTCARTATRGAGAGGFLHLLRLDSGQGVIRQAQF